MELGQVYGRLGKDKDEVEAYRSSSSAIHEPRRERKDRGNPSAKLMSMSAMVFLETANRAQAQRRALT